MFPTPPRQGSNSPPGDGQQSNACELPRGMLKLWIHWGMIPSLQCGTTVSLETYPLYDGWTE